MTTSVVADNYAKVLMDMNIAGEDIDSMRALLNDEALYGALANPFVERQAKHSVIEKLFPAAVVNFVKVMSDNGDITLAGDMIEAYDQLVLDRGNVVRATFTYVTKPDDAQVEKLKKLHLQPLRQGRRRTDAARGYLPGGRVYPGCGRQRAG